MGNRRSHTEDEEEDLTVGHTQTAKRTDVMPTYDLLFSFRIEHLSRSRWPRNLICLSAATRLQEERFQIPPKAQMSLVNVVCSIG
jgi:hypothetical protein